MSNPLNSSLEVGMRVLMILVDAFPAHLDINRLVLLDHGLLHSADLDGPESLHPPIPVRVGELGVKRQHIEDGLHVMIRAGLAGPSRATTGTGARGMPVVAVGRAVSVDDVRSLDDIE